MKLTFLRLAAPTLLWSVGACAARSPAAEAAPVARDTVLSGPEIRKKYFYARRPYGTESQLNPLTSIIHNGYDQIRTGPPSGRRIFKYQYGHNVTAAWQSIIHPRRLIREYGFDNWIKYEILPITLKGSGGGQWVPNYQLHLFGGGVTYVRLIAWFEQRDLPYPHVSAALTSYAGHFLNEMMENGDKTRGSIDAMTDLLVFDPAIYLLWSWSRVQRIVGQSIEVSEWQSQASLNFPGETLENVAQTTLVRVRVPGLTNWRAFTTMGGSYVGGASRRLGGDSTWWSLGVGWDAARNPVVDTTTGRKTVELLGNIGLFVDRSGSLLGSLVLKSGFDAGVNLNVYPGVIQLGSWSPGVWAHVLRSPTAVRFGVTAPIGIGVGRNP